MESTKAIQILQQKILEKKQEEEKKQIEQQLQVSTLVQNIQQVPSLEELRQKKRAEAYAQEEAKKQAQQTIATQQPPISKLRIPTDEEKKEIYQKRIDQARQLALQQQEEQKNQQQMNPFSRSLNLKENWGGLTTRFLSDPDEPVKELLRKLQKLETIPLENIPDILRTISHNECTFIGSEFLRNLFWCYGDIFKGYEGPHPNALIRSCGYNIQMLQFLYRRNFPFHNQAGPGIFEKDWYTGLTYTFGISQCIDIIKFLWTNENAALQSIPLIALACKVENVGMVHFLTENLRVKDILPPNGSQYFTTFAAQLHESIDGKLGIEICCRKNSITSSLLCIYLLRHNTYSASVYMALSCLELDMQIKGTCTHEILEQKRITPSSKAAAFLVAKAVQKKNFGILARFIREGFPLNGGSVGELPPNTPISPIHINDPIKFAKDIFFTEFLDWLQNYTKEIVGMRSVVMVQSLIRQGFREDYITSCYDCRIDCPEDIQFLEKIVTFQQPEGKTKDESMFLLACKSGSAQLLNHLIASKKITEIEIQRNDTFFQSIFQSPSSRKLELLKILIDCCGGIEKLEISMQRLMRFSEENPSPESDAIKEYLQSFTKNRLAKKRQISIESDNEETGSTPILQDPTLSIPSPAKRVITLSLSDPLEILANACACEETLQTFICKHCERPFDKVRSTHGPAPEVCNNCRNHRRRPRKNDNIESISKSVTPDIGKVLNLPETPQTQTQLEKPDVRIYPPSGSRRASEYPKRVPILQRSFPTLTSPTEIPIQNASTNRPVNMET